MDGRGALSTWVLIDRPIMDVFNYVADPGRLPDWVPFFSAVSDVRRDERRGHVVSYRATVWLSAVPQEVEVVITDSVPGRLLCYRALRLGLTATYTFEPTSKGTIVRTTQSLSSWAALGAWNPLLTTIVTDSLTQTHVALKRQLESRKSIQPEPLVFFSYRRDEAEFVGGRICTALSHEFGNGAIFRDISSILPGDQWEAVLEENLRRCEVVVALIGPRWADLLRLRDQKGKEPDWVRRELEVAIRLEKRIIPVYFGFDRVKDIPAEVFRGALEKLKDYQWHRLRPDPDFDRDMEKVMAGVWSSVAARASQPAAFEPARGD